MICSLSHDYSSGCMDLGTGDLVASRSGTIDHLHIRGFWGILSSQ